MAHRRIAFINGKGGTGKSTICVLIALALKHAGRKRVAIMDYDPQSTATEWLESSDNSDLIVSARASLDDCDILLNDTPPNLQSAAFATAVRASDALVLVTSPSPADLIVSQRTVEKLTELGIDTRRCRILFNQVQAGTKLSADLDKKAEMIGLVDLAGRVARRQTYQHTLLVGWDGLGGVAREEILAVALEIATLADPSSKRA